MSERVTLPTDVLPTHYSLELAPNFDKLEFFCNEEINVSVTKEGVTEVSMHSKEIFIESATFTPIISSSSVATVIEISYNVKYNTVKLVFDGPLTVGDGVIKLRYRGILNGDMAGFYKSTYADSNGNKKIMASTQFEALDARR